MMGFVDFMYKSIIPACLMAPMKPSFDLNDGQTSLVSRTLFWYPCKQCSGSINKHPVCLSANPYVHIHCTEPLVKLFAGFQ